MNAKQAKRFLSTLRERPICRREIRKRGLRPHLTQNGMWDRRAVRDSGLVSSLSDGMCIQMKKMILEGIWPEIDASNIWESWQSRKSKGEAKGERQRCN